MMKIVHGVFILIMSALSVLLFTEYYTLRHQVHRILEIQDEYQNTTEAFRKIARDYYRMKEGCEPGKEAELSSDEDDEKKKEQTFLVVNRERTYLKKSMTRFLKKNRMEQSLACVYDSDEYSGSMHYPAQRSNYYLRRMGRGKNKSYVRRGRKDRARSSLLSAQLRGRSFAGHARVTDIVFSWPIDRSQFWLSSPYGPRRNPNRTRGFHWGIDMAAIKGTPVTAVAAGVVIEAGYNKGYGNTIVIMHSEKYRTRYAHLHRIYVRQNQQVSAGDRIGAVGDTGHVRSRGNHASHLHFEVQEYGKKVNPLYFFI